MVKWCNEYGEMVQRIHTISHGDMMKHTSGDILFTKWKNGETVILTFVSPLFCAPLQQWVPSPLLDSISCCIRRLVSGCFRVDRIIVPLADQTPFNSVSPCCFRSKNFFFTFLLPLPTPWGFVALFNLLVLAIVRCFYTGDILYHLCATVTYTTFTNAIWSPYDRFAKVYFPV